MKIKTNHLLIGAGLVGAFYLLKKKEEVKATTNAVATTAQAQSGMGSLR